MGNVAITEELAGSAELDELYKLDASESGPEEDEEDEEDDEEDDEEEDDEDEGEGVKPQGMPHG
jgi:hypothetical protein